MVFYLFGNIDINISEIIVINLYENTPNQGISFFNNSSITKRKQMHSNDRLEI